MPEFDLGDINRAGGLPALCSTPRDRKTPGPGCLSARENELFSLSLSKEPSVGATQAFWTQLARLA